MKNKLSDLQNALFLELEMLQDEDNFKDEEGNIIQEKVDLACNRADKVNNIAGSIMELGRLQMQALVMANKMGIYAKMPELLGIEEYDAKR